MSKRRTRPKNDTNPIQRWAVIIGILLGAPLIVSVALALCGVLLTFSLDEFWSDVFGYWLAALVLGAAGALWYYIRDRHSTRGDKQNQAVSKSAHE